MKKKGNFRKVVSGLLAGMTMLSTVLSPMTAYAAEIQPEEKPPLYEEVKDLLDEDEVVTAKDYEIETGSVFDVKSDYTGLEIKDDNKVKVTFEEAKNDKDEDFTTDHADTYKAVYYVEPVNQEHPKYQISRKLIVREKATEAQTEVAGSEAVTESETAGSEQQTEEAEDSEADSEITDIDADEFDDLVEQAQNQDTYDEESGLELHDVLEQAGDEGVDLEAMEEGEIATFEAVSAYSARSTQQVTIEKGPLYRYADYNLGTYLTEPYYISYGSVRAIAYCVQPAKPGPGSGNYTITKIGDNQALAKVCYYGTDAAGSESFFANKHTDFSEGKRFIIIHMAASYANGSSDAFYGTNATGEALAKELYNYCVNKPEIPDVAMSFSKPDVKAYVDGNVQRTENIQFNASSQQKITMDLPKGVKLHNVSTGNVSAAGASVTIGGGTTFYLSAPLTQTRDVSATFSAKMKGSITKDYSAYKLTTNASVQDLAFVFGEGVADEKYVSLKVSWIEQATIEIVKKDDTADVNLAGAVFGVYSDEACTKLITQMPATDKNGKSSVTIIKTQDTVYLKEITAPQGYVVNATATNVKLVASKTSAVTVENKEQLAELTIYKEGQVLTGAEVSENGTVFQYENRRQKNAVYNVYAGADTFTADLPVDGKYYVKEIFAPDGFVTTEEVQEFTFEYAGEDQTEVSYDFTFENQPTTVELTKTDLTTGKELPGAHLKVTDSDGNIVDEWTSTEESHVIKELVVGKEYTMTETKPADGYVTAESITFTVENTAEVQKHEMKDDVTKVEISKTDITGETEIPGAKLTILDKDDQVVESWTSTEEAHYIEKLPIGKYTLREEQAPKGYLLTADVTFEVKDTGEIQKVAMKDDTAKGKVILNKTDKSSGEPLKGVEFELRDSKGKVLETLKTDAAGHAESKLYEIATFKNGKYDTAIKYYLVETKTLDGYTLDQTKHEVTF
ncbi:SpaA isopeptide-forming pilin-related protein, partial [Dorea longicatena]|uniref:SpaA isopeptide-forming pilin-related protein n=2 Tax=Dorea longicatena TaxID=88431 RepID=UPI00321AB7A5